MPKSITTYLKLCTEYYDLDPNKDNNLSIEFFMDYAIKANGPILEPMCGTGRFLIPILNAGLDIEGFDASPYMLDALKQKLASRSHQNASIWQQLIQDFKSEKNYNLIFVPSGSWGLITSLEDSKKSLEIMYNHLAPNGKFIIEIETVNSVPASLNKWHRSLYTRPDGSCIVLHTYPTYDSQSQIFRSICRYESIVGNDIEATETEDFQMYLYKFDELDKLLQAVGFTNIIKYQDYTKAPVTNIDTPRIIYECTK